MMLVLSPARRRGVAPLVTLLAASALSVAPMLAGPATAATGRHGQTHAVAPATDHTRSQLLPKLSQDTAGPATAEHGVLYLADYETGVVEKIDHDGTSSTVGSGFSSPMGVATDADGNVFVADGGNNTVVEVAWDGTQTTLPFTGLSYPIGVGVDAAGDVFVGDNLNNRVVELAPDGTQTTLPFANLHCPNGLAVDDAGNVYVTSFCSAAVFKMTPGGVQTTIGSGLSYPSGVDVDADGNVWIADPGLATVVEVAPDGTQTNVSFGDGAYPVGIGADSRGNVFDADFAVPSTVQRSPDGSLSTVAGGYAYDVAAVQERDIPFTSDAPTDAVPGDTYTVSASTDESDAPITFAGAKATSRQCQVTDNGDGTAEVELNRAGVCTIEATQPGGEGVAPGYGDQAVTIRHRQAITFTSTAQRPQVDGAYQVTATGGASETPVVYSLAGSSESGCTVTPQGHVTFDHATSCIIAADQDGNATYVPAATVSQQIAIGRGDQQVTFTSVNPAKRKVGKTYRPRTAGGASGHRVRVSATGACRVRSGVVTFTHVGHCYVYANQSGNADYLPGRAHQTIKVVKR